MDEMDDFLKGDDEPVAEVAEAPEPTETPTETVEQVEPEKTERARGPDGKFVAKGETESASPAPEKELDHPALLGERRRRQEAERELEELRAKYTQPAQQQQAPTQEQIPDRWDDPEGYDQWLIGRASETARAEALQAVQYQRIQTAAQRAIGKYPDYHEKHAVFGEMIQQNPGLFQKMMEADDPAEFAYSQAKTEVELRQYGGLDALVQARVEAALKEAQPQPQAAQVSIPETLAGEQSARAIGASSVPAPPTLDDILARRT